MSISEKIKVINNKIEQNKAQYDLDRHTAKILGLSSGNVKSWYNKKFWIFAVGKRIESTS